MDTNFTNIPSPKLTRIGLTGGMGSGKSCVALLLRQAAIAVLDLDQIGRELTNTDPRILAKIQALFSKAVVTPEGKLDRHKVKEIIFSDTASRQALEAFLHPLIWESFIARTEELAKQGKRLVICEAALLIESGIHKKLDGLILVTAPEEVRRQRVIDRDRVTALLAEKMIRTQLKDTEKHRPATVVIENKGSLADLALRVQELLETWRAEGLI